MAFVLPVAQLESFFGPPIGAHMVSSACVGLVLRTHPQLTNKDAVVTFVLGNATLLLRGALWYGRTGDPRGAQGLLLFNCLPFVIAYSLAAPAAAWALRRLRSVDTGAQPSEHSRRAHGSTAEHVDSICAVCQDLLATSVLKPCNLGLCPTCLAESAMASGWHKQLDHLPASCPTCFERVSHAVRIRHLDMDDDGDVDIFL